MHTLNVLDSFWIDLSTCSDVVIYLWTCWDVQSHQGNSGTYSGPCTCCYFKDLGVALSMKRSLSRSTDAISVTTFLAGTRHVDFLESYKRINPLDRVQTPKIFSCRTNCVSGSDQTKGPLADRLCPTRWPIVYTRRPSLFLGLLLHTPILPRLVYIYILMHAWS